ncbi:MAG TPA: cbb3-type cytochrome c oxidase N-terminal domain-containing protein [Chryseolinea sp.]
MKKITFLLAGLLAFMVARAQEPTPKTFWDDPVNNPATPLYVTAAFVFIVLLLVLTVSILMLRAFHMLIEQTEKAKAKSLGVAYAPRPSWWSTLTQKLNDSVPVEREQDIDLGHSFDGIRELDNHLPPWWKWLFYGTIAWAAVYLVVFHLSASLPLSLEEYQNEVAVAELEKQKLLASQPQAVIDVDKLAYTADAAIIGKGQKVFLDNCVSCHRKDGGGNTIGPNLTDDYWLHGNGIKNVYTTVNGGFIEKGMPAWGKALSPSEVRDVTFFVLSLQGSNPPNAKAAQGELAKPDASPKTDSLKVSAAL